MQAISRVVAAQVPDEPSADDKGKVARLRFRVSGGDIINRRFLASHRLNDVLNFLISRGFHIEDYKVLTTYPRRDVSRLSYRGFQNFDVLSTWVS